MERHGANTAAAIAILSSWVVGFLGVKEAWARAMAASVLVDPLKGCISGTTLAAQMTGKRNELMIESKTARFHHKALLLCLWLASSAWAQTSLDPLTTKDIETDRPDVTPSTVPKGSLQLENGIAWTRDELSRALDLTESLLRLGVSDSTEVRVGIPTYFNSIGHRPLESGFGDFLIGAKQRIASVAGFDLAIVPALSFPTGSKTRSSHGFDPQLEIPWEHELRGSWSLSGTVGIFYLTDGGGRRTLGENQIELETEVTRRTDLFLEYQSFLGDGAANNSLQMGGGYKLRPNHRLDCFLVVGLSRAAPNLAIAVGYSIRLDRLWAK